MNESFVKRTIEFWQPHYQRELSEEDAQQIITNITTLFKLLEEWIQKEKIDKNNDK